MSELDRSEACHQGCVLLLWTERDDWGYEQNVRIRQLHTELIEAKRRCNELQAQLVQLVLVWLESQDLGEAGNLEP
jgi:hypothetical protein